jgi:hypothetical protein
LRVPGRRHARPGLGDEAAGEDDRDDHVQVLETGWQQHRIDQIEHVADVIVGGDFRDPEQGLAVFSRVRWNDRSDALCMKNRANAARPKSAIAILPLRPFGESAKVAHTARKPARKDGKSHPNGESLLR